MLCSFVICLFLFYDSFVVYVCFVAWPLYVDRCLLLVGWCLLLVVCFVVLVGCFTCLVFVVYCFALPFVFF